MPQQITGNKPIFRLYAEHRDWCPEVRSYSSEEEEAKVNPEFFVTPYKYANAEQAERAMIYYIQQTLGLVGVRLQ